VYKGEYHGAPVAIKVLKGTALTPAVLAAFNDEAALHASLQFPHIAPLLGIVTDRAPNCIVLDLLDCSLFDLVHNATEAFPWEQRVRIALEIAAGLSFLHGNNILHRDMKPQNVLLTKDRLAKLSDFGLAKVKLHSGSTSTLAQGPKGTVSYMAPELFRLKALYGTPSDVYAFALTLWEMAARRYPFETAGGVTELIIHYVKNGERDDIPADAPPAFAEVIEHCWAQDPATRWDLATAMATLKGQGKGKAPMQSFDQFSK
jgi:serine/threonine protein kinase